MESHNPLQNYLLAAMPAEEFAHLAPRLEPVSLPHGKVLYEFNEKLKYAYFPTTATASLLCTMEDGASVEVAEVGNEGVLDVSILLGGDGALTQGIIQTAGQGYRLPAKWLIQENDQLGSLQTLLMRYTHTLISQMAQTTGCIRRHSVEQQFCRWLLLNFDRMNSSNLAMTQELMANMLGVRRETVTEAAGRLQDAGFITYRRGQIAVLNRLGLESQACECYGVVKQSFDRLRSDLVANRTHKHIHHDHDHDTPIHEAQASTPASIIPRSADRRRLNLYA